MIPLMMMTMKRTFKKKANKKNAFLCVLTLNPLVQCFLSVLEFHSTCEMLPFLLKEDKVNHLCFLVVCSYPQTF